MSKLNTKINFTYANIIEIELILTDLRTFSMSFRHYFFFAIVPGCV